MGELSALNLTGAHTHQHSERQYTAVTFTAFIVHIILSEHRFVEQLQNYLMQVSNLGYDYLDNDGSPFPSEYYGQRDDHGTGCAGEIAMVKNNNVCGVGVAYQSSITGEHILLTVLLNTVIVQVVIML